MNLTRLLIHKRIFIILILFPFISFAQPSKENVNPLQVNLFEVNFLPSNDSTDCYVSFNIPYNRLIYVKNGDLFSGGVEIFFDVKLNNKIDHRKYYSKNLSVNSYDETQNKDKFLEGVISLRLANKDYVIQPSLKIGNTNQTIKLDSITINLSRIHENIFYKPLVVENIGNSCSDKQALFRLVNRNNKIPFAARKYSLFIPVNSDSIKEALIKIEQPGQVVYDQKVIVNPSRNLIIDECDGSIVIASSSLLNNSNYILLEDFSQKLTEGPVTVKVINGSNESSFLINVEWLNKPVTLFNINLAVELLELIYDRAELLDLYKSSNQNKYKALVDFWNKKFPEREYMFNEWMDEFYKRSDYAMQNFSNLANQIGAKTDRGKIYIQYGKPDEIKRDYSSTNNVVEIWFYKDLQKEFIFTDRTGLGNYILSK